MKNWIIKKKPHGDSTDSDFQTRTVGCVNSVLAPSSSSDTSPNHDGNMNDSSPLVPISKDCDTMFEDHYDNVEFDLLESPNSLDVMTISGNISPYSDFKVPMDSMRSIASSQVTSDYSC
jgi:hypothetical protein